MLSFQRRDEIKRLLLDKKTITVGETAQLFDVSDETIRRDLSILCNEGFCTKTYGGASLAVRSIAGTASHIKKNLCLDEKRKMAQLAVSQIKTKDCIFLDHSTTVADLCPLLQNMHLTVVTNSMWVIRQLENHENINLISTGGTLNRQDQGMFGIATLNFLKNHYFDKAFFSCRSLNMKKGVYDSNEQIAAFHQVLAEQTDQRILMVDHTKFGNPSFVHVMPFRDVDMLITDTPLNDRWMEALNKNSVRVLDPEHPD